MTLHPNQTLVDLPLITVVTVVYNGVNAIRATMESVLEQTYPNLEYIVVDGGSNDGTVEVVREYAARISKWVSEPDSGIYNAMNKGVRMASGAYISLMNCGDTFASPNTLELVGQTLQGENSDVVYGDVLIKGEEGNRLKVAPEVLMEWHHIPFCHQSTLAKTALLRQYPFDEKYKMSADFKFFKQCFLGGKNFTKVGFPICVFDTSGVSNTSRAAGLRENNAIVRELDRFPQKQTNLLRTNFVLAWMAIRKLVKSTRSS